MASTRSSSRREGIKTILEAKTVNGRKRAHVEIRPEKGDTRVIARFGPLGDEALSRAFLDRMASRLGTVEAAKNEDVDVSAVLSDRPKKPRPIDQPPTMIDRQLEGGYRDSPVP